MTIFSVFSLRRFVFFNRYGKQSKNRHEIRTLFAGKTHFSRKDEPFLLDFSRNAAYIRKVSGLAARLERHPGGTNLCGPFPTANEGEKC